MRVQSGTNSRTASATEYVAGQLTEDCELTVLGAFPAALYLHRPGSPEVLAVLSADAVRLPIGLVLAEHSSRLALASVTEASVRDGELVLPGLRVRARVDRSAALRFAGRPVLPLPAATPASIGLPDELLAALGTDPASAVTGLLGRGPGLTPSGDDVLCGLLAGCVLFGVPAGDVRQAVLDELARRRRATTSLSGALLRRAVAGEGIEQLSTLARALCGTSVLRTARAWDELSAVGHSSGAALGLGLLTAARCASAPTMSKAG